MTTQINETPEGYMSDAQGRLVPLANVADIDLRRHKLVNKIIGNAQKIQGTMSAFHDKANTDIDKFIAFAEKKFGAKVGGKKGNLSLRSYDGKYKISITVANQVFYDERLNIAEELVNECILDWSEGADPKLISIVQGAFKRDAEGNAIPSKLKSLQKLKINDSKWRKAMKALNESEQIDSKKPYLRMYERDDNGEWVMIPLDLASMAMTTEVK